MIVFMNRAGNKYNVNIHMKPFDSKSFKKIQANNIIHVSPCSDPNDQQYKEIFTNSIKLFNEWVIEQEKDEKEKKKKTVQSVMMPRKSARLKIPKMNQLEEGNLTKTRRKRQRKPKKENEPKSEEEDTIDDESIEEPILAKKRCKSHSPFRTAGRHESGKDDNKGTEIQIQYVPVFLPSFINSTSNYPAQFLNPSSVNNSIPSQTNFIPNTLNSPSPIFYSAPNNFPQFTIFPPNAFFPPNSK